MTTFVALGDSITLGIGDPAPGPPGRAWRGWAGLLAEGLRDPLLHNLATSGAQAADVERDQLPRALELRPDVASVIVGINDTLRSSFDPPRIARAAEHTVGALCSAGAVVLTMRLPDPGLMLGLPCALSRPLARRGPPTGVPARSRAVQPAAEPPGQGGVDGDQGHGLGDQAVDRPGALPGADGAA